jgi:hypothetical protein
MWPRVQDVAHLGVEQAVHRLALHRNTHAHARTHRNIRTRPGHAHAHAPPHARTHTHTHTPHTHTHTHTNQRTAEWYKNGWVEGGERGVRLAELGEVRYGGRVDVRLERLLGQRPSRVVSEKTTALVRGVVRGVV